MSTLTPASLQLVLCGVITIVHVGHAIRCYECTAGQDNLCGRYVGRTCDYGFFGCIKIATFSGGVDKLGNFIRSDYRSVQSMIRGCNILPFGGVDACQQQVILGYRIVSCYCFSDYCNAAESTLRLTSPVVTVATAAALLALLLVNRILLLYD